MNKKHKTYHHAKTKLKVHLIFSTKYRKSCLEDIREELFDTFQIAVHKSDQQFKIDICEIDNNHIHFLISFKPNCPISYIVSQLKQYSTYFLWKNEETRRHLRKFYYGKQHYLWTRGYFCATIGEVSENKIYEYIKNQG